MNRFFDHIFACYDSLPPIDSDEIIKRLHIWLNNPQYGHKEGQTFPFFLVIYTYIFIFNVILMKLGFLKLF